ncbi:MAG: nucleotidyltransferase domain-containing protein [bacterium]|nr:nucleotidyltransferase domain-containing protein [bacterium]
MAGTGLLSQRDLAPYREYHARRSRERLARREALRQRCLDAARAGIRRLAPAFAPIRVVYLFGSLLQPGHFSRRSDIDVAIECDDIATEGRFRRAVEEELRQTIDLRPLEGGVAWAVEAYGECVYEREVPDPGA